MSLDRAMAAPPDDAAAGTECYLLEVFRAERDALVMAGGGSFTVEVNVGSGGQVSIGRVRTERRPKAWRGK